MESAVTAVNAANDATSDVDQETLPMSRRSAEAHAGAAQDSDPPKKVWVWAATSSSPVSRRSLWMSAVHLEPQDLFR